LLVLLAVGVLSLSPVADYDVWWHIANGQWLLEHGSAPGQDPYSHTAAHERDVLYSWLFDLGAALAAQGLGIERLPLLQAVLAAAVFGLLFLAGRTLGLSSAAAAAGLIAAAPILRFHLVLRPHLASYVLLALEVLLLARYGVSRRSRELWAVVLVLWVWRQFHASYPLGLLLLALSAACPRMLRTDGASRAEDPSPRRGHRILVLAAAALCFVLPPLGLEGARWILETLSLVASGGGLVTEWIPPVAFERGFGLYWL
jgi:hypothetical protein